MCAAWWPPTCDRRTSRTELPMHPGWILYVRRRGRCYVRRTGELDVFKRAAMSSTGRWFVATSMTVVVRGAGNAHLVELEEHGRAQPTQPLVAVDERMIVHDRLQQGSRLRPDIRVRIISEQARPRTSDRRAEQTDVADRRGITEQRSCQVDDVLEVEVLDGFVHWPSRSMASACTSKMRRAELATRSR